MALISVRFRVTEEVHYIRLANLSSGAGGELNSDFLFAVPLVRLALWLKSGSQHGSSDSRLALRLA
jgi:hypothetical protein